MQLFNLLKLGHKYMQILIGKRKKRRRKGRREEGREKGRKGGRENTRKFL